MVPIAPSKTMTWSGSSNRAISGFSGNGGLRFAGDVAGRAAHGVVLRPGVVHDHRRGRLLWQKLEGFGELHSERFLRRQQLEHGCVIVEIRTRAVTPRVALA